jgi:hypothetical protein
VSDSEGSAAHDDQETDNKIIKTIKYQYFMIN